MEDKNNEELLEDIKQKYNKKLSFLNKVDVENTIHLLEDRKRMVRSGRYKYLPIIDTIDTGINSVLELLKMYQREVRELYLKRGTSLTHITYVPLQDMVDGRIKRSLHCANHYETELGDWVFASSIPADGRNPYLATNPNGIIRISENVYIYGGDIFEVIQNEGGDNLLFLKRPNFVYELSPQSFTPVVSLQRNKDGEIVFDFSGEWTSSEDINIGDGTVRSIGEIRHVTELLNYYQILSDVNNNGIGKKVLQCKSKEDALGVIKENLNKCNLRYLNGEVGINVSHSTIQLLKNSSNKDDIEESR